MCAFCIFHFGGVLFDTISDACCYTNFARPHSKFYLDMHDSFICPLFLYGFFIVFDASKNALDTKPIMNGLSGIFLLTISVEEIYVRSTLRRLDLNICKKNLSYNLVYFKALFRPITKNVSLQKFVF